MEGRAPISHAPIYGRPVRIKQPFKKDHVALASRDVQRDLTEAVPVVHVPRVVLNPLAQLGGREVPKHVFFLGGCGLHRLLVPVGVVGRW